MIEVTNFLFQHPTLTKKVHRLASLEFFFLYCLNIPLAWDHLVAYISAEPYGLNSLWGVPLEWCQAFGYYSNHIIYCLVFFIMIGYGLTTLVKQRKWKYEYFWIAAALHVYLLHGEKAQIKAKSWKNRKGKQFYLLKYRVGEHEGVILPYMFPVFFHIHKKIRAQILYGGVDYFCVVFVAIFFTLTYWQFFWIFIIFSLEVCLLGASAFERIKRRRHLLDLIVNTNVVPKEFQAGLEVAEKASKK